MKVEFDKSFQKSIRKLKSQDVAQRVLDAITNVEVSISLNDIKALKKLVGYKNYYRVRIGDYRIGLKLVDATTLRFIVVAHRKDLYTLFP